ASMVGLAGFVLERKGGGKAHRSLCEMFPALFFLPRRVFYRHEFFENAFVSRRRVYRLGKVVLRTGEISVARQQFSEPQGGRRKERRQAFGLLIRCPGTSSVAEATSAWSHVV